MTNLKNPRRRILRAALTAAFVLTFTAAAQASAHRTLPFHGPALCVPLSPIVREEQLPRGARNPLPPLEDGDILLTACAHSFGWRHGHAALVVNAAQGTTLEAFTIGVPSGLRQTARWENYPSYAVLRLKGATAEQRRTIARYAQSHLTQVPYRLTSGLVGERTADPPPGSQCAYLVWCAYRHFGIDLDSDGGRLVTVADLWSSPLLETVYSVGS